MTETKELARKIWREIMNSDEGGVVILERELNRLASEYSKPGERCPKCLSHSPRNRRCIIIRNLPHNAETMSQFPHVCVTCDDPWHLKSGDAPATPAERVYVHDGKYPQGRWIGEKLNLPNIPLLGPSKSLAENYELLWAKYTQATCGKNMGNDLLIIPCDLAKGHDGPCERNVWPVNAEDAPAGTTPDAEQVIEKLVLKYARTGQDYEWVKKWLASCVKEAYNAGWSAAGASSAPPEAQGTCFAPMHMTGGLYAILHPKRDDCQNWQPSPPAGQPTTNTCECGHEMSMHYGGATRDCTCLTYQHAARFKGKESGNAR